ncbi:uncharacterized protein LOC111672935 [Seriola lalandi dorsalis]|uniref:uncharacterized protein LOC111672935 n=1 Tax=Seriola lalandi dorsalis TaxID=1841481 RepID=UPI000C6FB422|nr:uncharacterized protein LOC111672935 [Seriola lalandi dorsalis]
MCTTGDNGEIIILSDDEDDEEHAISCSESSVLIVEVEDTKKSDFVLPPNALDEDLVVTFSRRAEVLPHARYDCPIHPFTATDCEINAPVASNQLMCDQCFCYICDKLASACAMWCHSGTCHCNSHKRSDFWNNLRNGTLLGGLKTFKLTLSEIDGHLRRAEMMLQCFKQDLSAQLLIFMMGKTLQDYGVNLPNQRARIFDYTPVYEFVSSFLNKADEQDERAAAIMRLGAAEDFVKHFQPSEGLIIQSAFACVDMAKATLLHRVVSSMQRQLVMADFTPEFNQKLQNFYKRLQLPVKLKTMRNSLCVRPWEDVLLVSVLKGQNVSGVRKNKGKRDVLSEPLSIVQLRTELLQQQHRYRELSRYLRVVQSDGSALFQQVQDLIPFFMCMDGHFMTACNSLFPSVNAPASRFTPSLFLFYLRIFETATAPKLTVSQPAELCCPDAPWEPIKDAVPLKRAELVKFALRVQRFCFAVFIDSQCWTRLLTVVNTPSGSVTALPAPNAEFLHEAKEVVNDVILHKQHGSNIQIPWIFLEVYPDQALLLLVTGALGLRILNGALSPALPVLNTFKENVWALQWLWENLSSDTERLNSFLREITQEVENTSDGDNSLPFLRYIMPTLSSSTESWDHTYSAVKLCLPRVNVSSQCQLLS